MPDGVVWGGRRIQAAELANQPVEDEGERYEGDESGEENPGQNGEGESSIKEDVDDVEGIAGGGRRGGRCETESDEEKEEEEEGQSRHKRRRTERSQTSQVLDDRLRKVEQELERLKALLQDKTAKASGQSGNVKEEDFAFPRSMDAIQL